MPIKDYQARLDSYWENIEQSDEIIQENKGTLRDFARDQKLNDLSLARIYKLITYMGPMAKQLDKPFEKADRDDIKDILEWVQDKGVADSTERDYKVILKKFYKWMNGGDYPEKVNWINTTKKKKNNKLPEKLLTEEDVEKMIHTAENPRDKAFIALLWETGARIGELIDLEVGSIEDRENGKR